MDRSQRYGDKKPLAPIPEHSTKTSRPYTVYDGDLKTGTSRQGKSSRTVDAYPPHNRQKKDPKGRKTNSLPARPVYHYRLITHQDLKPDDIIIAVMGASGCGKSTFISRATGYEGGVGHSLEPCTRKIQMVKISSTGFNNPDIVLVDTPGFHDSPMHLKLLQELSKHLTPSGSNAKRHQLSGLLYFHRMTDNRIREAFPIHDLEIFPELFCSGVYRNVALVTTMWDTMDKQMGELREEQLCRRYWRAMSDRRSPMLRFKNTHESAWSILRPIIQKTREMREKAFNREVTLLHTQLRATPGARQAFGETESEMEKSLERMMKICSDHHEVRKPETMLKEADMNGIRAIGGTLLGALICLGGRTLMQ